MNSKDVDQTLCCSLTPEDRFSRFEAHMINGILHLIISYVHVIYGSKKFLSQISYLITTRVRFSISLDEAQIKMISLYPCIGKLFINA